LKNLPLSLPANSAWQIPAGLIQAMHRNFIRLVPDTNQEKVLTTEKRGKQREFPLPARRAPRETAPLFMMKT